MDHFVGQSAEDGIDGVKILVNILDLSGPDGFYRGYSQVQVDMGVDPQQ